LASLFEISDKPNGIYFGRARVNGKSIRRSLQSHGFGMANLDLSDFLQDHRTFATAVRAALRNGARDLSRRNVPTPQTR